MPRLKHRCGKCVTSFSANQVAFLFWSPCCSAADTLSQSVQGLLPPSLSAGLPGWRASTRQQAPCSLAGTHTSCRCSSHHAPLWPSPYPGSFSALNSTSTAFSYHSSAEGDCEAASVSSGYGPPPCPQWFLIFFSWAMLGLDGNHPEACHCPGHHLQRAAHITSPSVPVILSSPDPQPQSCGSGSAAEGLTLSPFPPPKNSQHLYSDGYYCMPGTHSKHFTNGISEKPSEVGITVSTILPIGKPRHREIKGFAQGHAASMGWPWYLTSCHLFPTVMFHLSEKIYPGSRWWGTDLEIQKLRMWLSFPFHFCGSIPSLWQWRGLDMRAGLHISISHIYLSHTHIYISTYT